VINYGLQLVFEVGYYEVGKPIAAVTPMHQLVITLMKPGQWITTFLRE